MISKNFKIKAGFSLLMVLCLWGSAMGAESSVYTVRLGEFKTIPAITEFYRLIPDRLHKNTMVCRSGATYILNCGAYAQEKDIQPIFVQLKDLGLDPRIVKQDFKNESVECSEADTFFKFADYPPLPPAPAVPPPQAPYADLDDPDVMAGIAGGSMTVLPEVTTKIYLSNRDVNRIICRNGPIKDIVYSQEKGITVKTSLSNAFVKFLISGPDATRGMTYSETPSEIYVVCGNDNTVYSLIAEPRNIPAQTITLASRKQNIQKTLSVFEGLAFEKKVILLIQSAYRDENLESFTVNAVQEPMDIFRDIDVLFNRRIMADGEGLLLKEYLLSMKPTSDAVDIPLDEKFFLIPEITQKPVGIALEHMTLTQGKPARLFVVEQDKD